MAAARSIALLAPTLAASLGLFATGCAAPGAPRGGSVWEVQVEPRGLLQVPAEPVTVRSNDAMPGSVTQQRWILTEARVGSGTVEAAYRRPWEQDVAPAKRFSVSVRVEQAKVPSRNP
jgi:predicted secreted protein